MLGFSKQYPSCPTDVVGIVVAGDEAGVVEDSRCGTSVDVAGVVDGVTVEVGGAVVGPAVDDEVEDINVGTKVVVG